MARREFTAKTKAMAFDASGGRCVDCAVKLSPLTGIEYDHRVPTGWLGGDNGVENCAPRCRNCHGAKTATEAGDRARGARAKRRHIGAKAETAYPVRGSKAHWLYERDRARILQERQRKREKGRA